MPTVLNISEAASLGLHAMGYLAARPDEVAPNAEIAKALGVSSAHLQKVLQRLNHAGLVASHPGPGGGYMLARPAERIRLLEVYEAVSGPLSPTHCLLGKPVCDGHCLLGDLIRRVDTEVADYLRKTKLSDLVAVGGRA